MSGIGDGALLNAHINRILDDDIPGNTINNYEVIFDINALAAWLTARFRRAFRSSCPLACPIALQLQGLDHLQQTIAANIVDALLLRIAAQIDATIVSSVLYLSAILLDLQSGCVANNLQTTRIVYNAHPIAVPDDAQVTAIVLDAILLAVAHQIPASVNGTRGTRAAGLLGAALLGIACFALVLLLVCR